MVDNERINQVLDNSKNSLSIIGIEDDLAKDVLSYRLLIERLGEKNNNNWWNSQVLTSFGRDSLREITPRSWVKSRIILAQKTGKKVEREILSQVEEYVSLFHLQTKIENRIENSIEKISENDPFSSLEDLDIELSSDNWSNTLVDRDMDIHVGPDDFVKIGEIEMPDLENEEDLKEYVKDLVYAYGQSTKNDLIVPYFEVEE